MLDIIGAGGNVGSTTTAVLRKNGAPVRAILHDPGKAARLEALGCEIAITDLQQPGPLAHAIAGVDAVQVVVPLRLQVAVERTRYAGGHVRRGERQGRFVAHGLSGF